MYLRPSCQLCTLASCQPLAKTTTNKTNNTHNTQRVAHFQNLPNNSCLTFLRHVSYYTYFPEISCRSTWECPQFQVPEIRKAWKDLSLCLYEYTSNIYIYICIYIHIYIYIIPVEPYGPNPPISTFVAWPRNRHMVHHYRSESAEKGLPDLIDGVTCMGNGRKGASPLQMGRR